LSIPEVCVSQVPGFEVVFLLGTSFRAAIDALHAELAQQGHPGARPLHGFALQAIGSNGASISELGRALGVTKQAAAKTAKALEEAGYAARRPDPRDARATLLTRTPRGTELLTLSARIFETQVTAWRDTLGPERFDAMVSALQQIGAGSRLGDFPGWLGPDA
jgi:DNA-binding MarR family transcriptional regulator